MATTKKATGFELSCPECGQEGVTIMMDLSALGECRCEECSETFTVAGAVRKTAETLAAWRKIERLVEMAGELAAE